MVGRAGWGHIRQDQNLIQKRSGRIRTGQQWSTKPGKEELLASMVMDPAVLTTLLTPGFHRENITQWFDGIWVISLVMRNTCAGGPLSIKSRINLTWIL